MRVVVVGAGIVGAAAAAALSAKGAEVLVIDNSDPARATNAGAGIIAAVSSRVTSASVAGFRFAAAAHYLDLIETLCTAGYSDHSYDITGQLTVALDDSEAARLDAEYQRVVELVDQCGARGVGHPQRWEKKDILDRFPQVSRALGGVWLPEIGRVDGRVICAGLMRLALQAGATHLKAPAQLENSNGRVAVRTPDELIEGDAVLLAAGAWSADLAAAVGLSLDVRPQRGQIVHLQLPGGSTLPALESLSGHYLLSFPGDRVVIGATREDDAGFDAALTAGGLAQVLANGMTLVPELAGATWLQARVGLRPISSDGLPLLGALGSAGLWVATGMGPSGLTVGPYSGAVIAAQILGESVDIPAEFEPSRLDKSSAP